MCARARQCGPKRLIEGYVGGIAQWRRLGAIGWMSPLGCRRFDAIA
jgi:hypothetical protein